MSEFRLNFKTPLTSVSAPGVVTTALEDDSKALAQRDADAFTALTAAQTSLAKIEQGLTVRLDSMNSAVTDMAINVARYVFNSDQELISKRATEFVSAAFAELHPSVPNAVFVHPDCVATIEGWMAKSGEGPFAIHGDESILPGDCRIESGTQGVMADLDALLDSVVEHLSGTQKEH